MDVYIERAVKGDQQAILHLLEQDEEVLYSIAYTYVKNEHDALDAMQELTYKAVNNPRLKSRACEVSKKTSGPIRLESLFVADSFKSS